MDTTQGLADLLCQLSRCHGSAEHQLVKMLGEHAAVSIDLRARTKPLSTHQNPPHTRLERRISMVLTANKLNVIIYKSRQCNDEQHTYTGEGASN